MSIESRIRNLENVVGSEDAPSLYRLFGVNALGSPPVEPYSEEEIVSLSQTSPSFRALIRALLGSEVDGLTAEELAAEVISWKREGVAAWQYRHGILKTDPAGWQGGATAAALAADPPEGPQDARSGDDRPDGPNIDPGPQR